MNLKELNLELSNLKDELFNHTIKSTATLRECRITDLTDKKLFLNFEGDCSLPLPINVYKDRLITTSETDELINKCITLINQRNKLKRGGEKNA